MKKILRLVKNNLVAFIIGAIIFSCVGIYAATNTTLLSSAVVTYDNTMSGSSETTVQGALTDLYGIANTLQASSGSCPEGYICTQKLTVQDLGGIVLPAPAGETYKAVAYFDPTEKVRNCDNTNYVSTTGTKEGCMKFYIYDEDNDFYYAILDHNTTASLPSFGVAVTQLETDTSDWTAVRYTDVSKNPRNITAEELWQITKNTNGKTSWDLSWFYFNAINANDGVGYAWLLDYTNNCTSYGCVYNDSSNYGYWTSDISSPTTAWYVLREGRMLSNSVNNAGFGVRQL